VANVLKTPANWPKKIMAAAAKRAGNKLDYCPVTPRFGWKLARVILPGRMGLIQPCQQLSPKPVENFAFRR